MTYGAIALALGERPDLLMAFIRHAGIPLLL